MTYLITLQYYVVLILGLISVCIAISNSFFLKKLIVKKTRLNKDIIISVLIPARNEEDKISQCLDSLISQTYANLEIIVLDDNSNDETAGIVSRFVEDDKRVKLIHGEELPLGWGGKNWACHQLYNSANGEYILFLDADTIFQKDTIASAIHESVSNNIDLLTLIPKRPPKSIVELAMFPFMNWAIFSWLPIKIAHNFNNSYLSATFGQFMLFKKESYSHIGGHEEVRDNAIDDFQLGRFIKKSGLKWMLLDGTEMVESMPYKNTIDALNGISRSVFPALNYSISVLFIFSILLVCLTFIPLMTVGYGLIGVVGNGEYWTISVLSLFIFLISWTLSCRRFHYSLFLIPFFPICVGVMIIVAYHSMLSTIFKTTIWKERNISSRKLRF